MGENLSGKVHFFLALIILLLLGNVLVLNYKIFYASDKTKDIEPETEFTVVNTASSSATIDSCYPFSCPDLIKQATESLVPKTVIDKPAQSTSRAGEFYITFGSGQLKADEWEDVPGLAVYIDNTKYGNIKKVTFEVSMKILNAHGTSFARVFNATDNHPVWASEISTESDKSQLIVSSLITLDSGNKLYKVQLKNTVKEVTIIDQARIRIITQ